LMFVCGVDVDVVPRWRLPKYAFLYALYNLFLKIT